MFLGKLRKSLRDVRKKAARRGTQHWTCNVPAPAPPPGSTFSVPLLVQSASVAAPLFILGPSFLPGTRAPITMQGLAFPLIPSAPLLFSGALGVPRRALGLHRVPQYRQWQERHGPSGHALWWCIYGPSSLANVELEVEQRTRAPELNAVRDARVTAAAPVAGSSHSRTMEQAPLKPRRASSQVASQRSLTPTRGSRPLPASPQDGTSQDVKEVQDISPP